MTEPTDLPSTRPPVPGAAGVPPYAGPPYAPPPYAAVPPGYAGPPTTGYYAPPPGMYPAPPMMYPPGYRPVAVAPDGQPLAGFGDRFVARLLDGLILGAVGLVLAIPVFVIVFARLSSLPADGSEPPDFGPFLLTIFALEAGLFVLILAATYVYEVEMLYRSGQTIGKRVMKIKIIPMQPGAPLTRGAATRRWLVGQVAASFVPLFNWLDGLWQLWDKPYQQCLHDKAAGTVVVKLPS
jgi:uncharacterized RDD family membrane protein YckC